MFLIEFLETVATETQSMQKVRTYVHTCMCVCVCVCVCMYVCTHTHYASHLHACNYASNMLYKL